MLSNIALLKAQVKVVKGSFAKRVWNKVKFPIGMAVGALLTHGVGL